MNGLCDWQLDPDEDGNIPRCGKEARAVYIRSNPKANHPMQPRFIRHPACRYHDTPARQRAADDQGYSREAVS